MLVQGLKRVNLVKRVQKIIFDVKVGFEFWIIGFKKTFLVFGGGF